MYLEKDDLAVTAKQRVLLPNTTSGFTLLRKSDVNALLIKRILLSLNDYDAYVDALVLRIRFMDDTSDLYYELRKSLWFVLLRDSFISYLHKKNIFSLGENEREELIPLFREFVKTVIGVYTDYTSFLNYATKDFKNVPKEFIDFDIFLDKYKFISVAQICIVVTKT